MRPPAGLDDHDRIDFDRVIFDPEYRQAVIARLNACGAPAPDGGRVAYRRSEAGSLHASA